MLAVAERVDRPSDSADRASRDDTLAHGFVEYVNRAAGYRFVYPQAWDLRDEDRVARVTSPDGTIDLSFRPRTDGEGRPALSSLLRPLNQERPHERLIGSRWELIGGSLSHIVGGMATDGTGHRVRFLEISVGAEPNDYAITIVVPFGSDPAQVLPLVEEIVSSFEMIG
jgi:hypothetical protein